MPDAPIPSAAPPLEELIAARYSRRDALKTFVAAASAATSAVARGGMSTCAPAGETKDGVGAESPLPRKGPPGGGSTLTFEEIPHGYDEQAHVPRGHRLDVLIRWGDAVLPDAPPFDVHAQSAAAQEKQFGYNNDFVAFMPLPRGSENSDHGLLCVNHEYTNAYLMFPGMTIDDRLMKITREQAEIEMSAHGHSVVEIERRGGKWRVVPGSRFNRRISGRTTPMRVAGPAAGHARLKTSADPSGKAVIGMLNNCAGGVTPWGTVLSGEENFHYYFGGTPSAPREAANYAAYGLTGAAEYAWWKYVDRFDLAKEPHEPNRFGWIVEFDPYDPASVPVKRTALGRCRHEGAGTALNHDGRVVLYSGDDQTGQFLYKFVTARAFVAGPTSDEEMRDANRDLLDDGVLHAARFHADGRLQWLPLVHGQGPLTRENGFETQADVLIETRRAAALLGATPMDRPEDVEENPVTGRVYVMLTNNTGRTAEQIEPANPRAENKHGHIIEIVPPTICHGLPCADHGASECQWNLFLLAGDPRVAAQGARYHAETSANGWFSSPDNCTFDIEGRIWIATDGAPDTSGIADGLYAADTLGPGRALTRRFFAAPKGAEVCGPAFTPDGRTLFIAVQHPGEEAESTFDTPATRWPDFNDAMPPRPAVVAITREDGGAIG